MEKKITNTPLDKVKRRTERFKDKGYAVIVHDLAFSAYSEIIPDMKAHLIKRK